MENNSVQKTDSDMRAQQHLNNLKDIVMRQTDYSEEQALEKLKEHNKDVIAIVREFMGVSTKTTKDTKNNNNTSVNQQIYGEIRNLMDTAAASYKAKKEAEERYEQRRQLYIAQARKELERRKALLAADSSNNIVADANTTTTDVITTADVNTTTDVTITADVVNL